MSTICSYIKKCDFCGITDNDIESYVNAKINTHYFRLNSYENYIHGSMHMDTDHVDLCPKCEKYFLELIKNKIKTKEGE